MQPRKDFNKRLVKLIFLMNLNQEQFNVENVNQIT